MRNGETKMLNLIWTWRSFHLADLSDGDLTALLETWFYSSNFNALAVPIDASVNVSTGEISFSSDSITDFNRISSFAVSVGFTEIYASCYMGYGTPSEMPLIQYDYVRTELIHDIEALVTGSLTNCAGWWDDLEMDYTQGGNDQNYLDYISALTTMLHSHSLFAGAYILASTYPYMETVHLPAILPNLYTDCAIFATDNLTYIDMANDTAVFNWVPHLQAESGMANEINFWENTIMPSYSGLPHNQVGFSVWAYPFLVGAELTAWQNWIVKNGQVSLPYFTPTAGTYGAAQNVAIACVTSSSTVYYTADGSPPTILSTEYTVPIAVAVDTTLKALAVKAAFVDSEIATAIYDINLPPPEAAPIIVIQNVSRMMRN